MAVNTAQSRDSVSHNIPPKNLDAEKNFLGNLMLDGTLLQRVIDEGGERITPDDFASQKNRIIYKAILSRANVADNFEATLIGADLENSGLLDKAGGLPYLMSLTEVTGSGSAILDYARIIVDTAKRRRLIAVSEAIQNTAYNPGGLSVDEIYDKAQGLLFTLAEENAHQDSGPQEMLQIAHRVIEQIRRDIGTNIHMRGIPSGFTELDELLSGLRGQCLYIIAARPGVGKTSFAMNIVENIVTNVEVKKPAIVFSLEMPAEQIAMRMLSTFGRVSTEQLSNGVATPQQWHSIIRKINLLSYNDEHGDSHNKLYIDDSADITPLELRSRARKIYEENGGLSVIMVDYIQLMRGQSKSENRSLEVGEISRSLKALSKELDVPVLALSQLNREVEGRRDHRPMNSDLRESGSLEQDADVILFIDRNVKNKESESYTLDESKATLIVGKNRHGGTADIPLLFQGAYTAFYDMHDPGAQDDDLPPPDESQMYQ